MMDFTANKTEKRNAAKENQDILLAELIYFYLLRWQVVQFSPAACKSATSAVVFPCQKTELHPSQWLG